MWMAIWFRPSEFWIVPVVISMTSPHCGPESGVGHPVPALKAYSIKEIQVVLFIRLWLGDRLPAADLADDEFHLG